MKATEVYSWRVDRHLKESLETAARNEHISVAGLLSRIVRDWLARGYEIGDKAAQDCVREEASKYLGVVHGGEPSRASESSARARQVIREKHASRRID